MGLIILFQMLYVVSYKTHIRREITKHFAVIKKQCTNTYVLELFKYNNFRKQDQLLFDYLCLKI